MAAKAQLAKPTLAATKFSLSLTQTVKLRNGSHRRRRAGWVLCRAFLFLPLPNKASYLSLKTVPGNPTIAQLHTPAKSLQRLNYPVVGHPVWLPFFFQPTLPNKRVGSFICSAGTFFSHEQRRPNSLHKVVKGFAGRKFRVYFLLCHITNVGRSKNIQKIF